MNFRKRTYLLLDQQLDLTPITTTEPAQDKTVTTTQNRTCDLQRIPAAVACTSTLSASNSCCSLEQNHHRRKYREANHQKTSKLFVVQIFHQQNLI